MSVLIKGITLDDFVRYGGDYAEYLDGTGCTVELPGDHGDLIDRETLKDKAEFIGDAFSGRGGFAVWGTDVINAPAVISAERNE